MKKSLSFILALVLGLSWPVLASNLTQQQSTLYPFRNTFALQDDFIGGNTASGSIGVLGWISAAATITSILGETNRPGIIRIDSTAVPGTIGRIVLSGGNAATDPSVSHSISYDARLNTNDANTTLRIGEMAATAASPPVNGIYLEKLDADTNWFCVARAAGVQTRTNSTVAVNTAFNTFAFTRNSSGIQYRINNVNVCGVIATNIPTAIQNQVIQIVTSAAAAKTVDVDYFQMKTAALVR